MYIEIFDLDKKSYLYANSNCFSFVMFLFKKNLTFFLFFCFASLFFSCYYLPGNTN